MRKLLPSLLCLLASALAGCDNPFQFDFPVVDPCGGGPCNDLAKFDLLVNETNETVTVDVVEAPPDLAFETRVFNPHPDAPLLERLFLGRPRTSTVVAPGGTTERRGYARFLAGLAPLASSASLVTVSAPGREPATFVVAGFGRAPIRVSGRRLAVVIDAPNEVLFATELSKPEKPACEAAAVTSTLRWTYARPFSTYSAVATQAWKDGCIDVSFADASTLTACIPQEAWPFVVGDELQVTDVKGPKVDTDPIQPRGVVADELDVIGRKHTLSLRRASTVTSKTMPKLLGLELAFENAATCVTIDEECGDARHPVTVAISRVPPIPIERGASFVDPASPDAKYWVLGAYASPIVRETCGDGRDRPLAGLRVDIVKLAPNP